MLAVTPSSPAFSLQVNNAGAAARGAVLDLPIKNVQALFDVGAPGLPTLLPARAHRVDGVPPPSPPLTLPTPPAPPWRRAPQVNYFGCVRMAQAVGKVMVAQRTGTIINIGSMSALWSMPFLGVYSGTKAALAALSDALRVELHPFGVHVMHVTLGFVRTK
jgi:short-subunit dehydrogenase